jgi:phenylacetate-CoA ligase
LPNTTSVKTKIYNLLQSSILITSYHLTEDKIKNIIDTVNSTNANYIYGYSSTISLIAKTAKLKNWKINRKINGIFTTSDMLYPNQRETITKIFGSEVFDNYGCPEGGVITFECENHNGYHINQESAYVEIVNQSNNGIGNIISTPLYSYAFPLIRYNTGDVGKIDYTHCSCERGLSKISELGGRIRDFIILEDGRYIHGAFFNHLEALYNAKWISQYQIVQEDLNELTIKISTLSKPIENDLKLIRENLQKGLLPSVKINFDFSGVEYTNGGKFRLIISNVKNNWEKT